MACAILNGVFFMLLKKIINLLFPQKCMFCQRITEGEHICFSCRGTLPYRDAFVEGVSYADAVYAPLRYRKPVTEAIHRFKFSGQSFLAEPFGDLIADCLRQQLRHGVDLVTWVPVNRFRKRRRGYDQAQLLAEQVAKALVWQAEKITSGNCRYHPGNRYGRGFQRNYLHQNQGRNSKRQVSKSQC